MLQYVKVFFLKKTFKKLLNKIYEFLLVISLCSFAYMHILESNYYMYTYPQ